MNDEPHYVRRYNRWVPEPPPEPPRGLTAARWALIIGLIMAATSIVVLVSLWVGDAAADGFGPLIPVTPSSTPYPNGWTP